MTLTATKVPESVLLHVERQSAPWMTWRAKKGTPLCDEKMTGETPRADLLVRLSLDLNGSFEDLMLAYQDRIYSFAFRLSGDPRDAEEISQDAFVAAYRGLQGYEPERIRGLALRPWLYRIALNVYRNRSRRKRVTTVDLDRDAPGDEAGYTPTAYQPPAPETSRPEAIVEQRELQERLAALVAGLPERYRVAVVLRFIEGLSYAELAEALDQPVGTVKSNVHRAIERLRNNVFLDEPSREVEYERQ